MKTKVKRYLQSSQGNLALIIFDFYSILENIEKEFEANLTKKLALCEQIEAEAVEGASAIAVSGCLKVP